MDTSIPDLGQQRPGSFDRIDIFFPAGDEPGSPPLKAGGNRCTVSGCPCPYFVVGTEQEYLCGNCGHTYNMHW